MHKVQLLESSLIILFWNIGVYLFIYIYIYIIIVVSDSVIPQNSSLPDFSVHGIFQARILEWVAFSYSRASSHPKRMNPCLLCLLHWQEGS